MFFQKKFTKMAWVCEGFIGIIGEKCLSLNWEKLWCLNLAFCWDSTAAKLVLKRQETFFFGFATDLNPLDS